MVVLSEHPSACYFRDRWGRWWRVYDGRERPPVTGAPFRYSVGPDKRRYRYAFSAGDDRELSPRLLVSQRERAQRIRP